MKDDFNWIFKKLPSWLRWILSPVVSVLGGIIAYFVLFAVLYLTNLFTPPAFKMDYTSWYGEIFKNILCVGCVLYLLFLIVPKRKVLITGIVSLTLAVASLAFTTALLMMNDTINAFANISTELIILSVSIFLLVKSKELEAKISKPLNDKE